MATDTLSVEDVSELLRQSMPALDIFTQEFDVLGISTSGRWDDCYIQVTVNPDQDTLHVQLIIQGEEGSPVRFAELLRHCEVVLKTGDNRKTVGQIVDDWDHAGAHAAEFEVSIADIQPGSVLVFSKPAAEVET